MTHYQHLPPPPDPETGEPRPPLGIALHGITAPKGKREKTLRRVKIPDAPPGWGPMLEWWQGPRGTRYGAAAFFAVLLAAFATWRWGGIGWADVWWMWLVIAVCASPFLVIDRRPIAAGAQWLYFKGTWVNTYQLTTVQVTQSHPGHALILTELAPVTARTRFGPHTLRRWAMTALTLGEHTPDDPSLAVNAQTVQENPKLWALVYNGIRHSVNNGAHCDEETRALLGLDLWPDVDAWSTPSTGSEEELRQGEQAIDAHADPDIAEELKKELRRHYRDQ